MAGCDSAGTRATVPPRPSPPAWACRAARRAATQPGPAGRPGERRRSLLPRRGAGRRDQLGKDRELRDYVWWTAQDAADYADGQLAEALRQLRAGELGEEYVPSDEDLAWARRELGGPVTEEPH
jgi:hypothetical protein